METNASVSKQARLRGGMAWILSFLLCLFLTVLSLLSLLECTLLSPGFLKKQVDKSAYTAHVIEDMEDIFVSYGISSDFDEAFFTSVLTEEEVRADIYAEIDRLYAADATGADYGAFESQLYDKLTANVKERNLEITESVDQALHYLAQMCAENVPGGGWPSLCVLCRQRPGGGQNAAAHRHRGHGGSFAVCFGLSVRPTEKERLFPLRDLCVQRGRGNADGAGAGGSAVRQNRKNWADRQGAILFGDQLRHADGHAAVCRRGYPARRRADSGPAIWVFR